MAVQKYGAQIACTGTDQWKRAVTRAAVQYGIFVQFTDLEMQNALDWEKQTANPLQVRAARLHLIETRLRTEEAEDLLLPTKPRFRNCFHASSRPLMAYRMLEVLKTSQDRDPKANVGGNLTVTILKTPQGQPTFRVSVHEGKRQQIIDRIVQLRQTAHWALHGNISLGYHLKSGHTLSVQNRPTDWPET